MALHFWHSIGLTAFCLITVGRVDAAIIIEADGARRDPANSVNSRDIGSIRVTNDTNHSASRPPRPDVTRSETTFADSLADGQFRLFSAEVNRQSDAIASTPDERIAPPQKASVIADGLRHSGDWSQLHLQTDDAIQIPPTLAVEDDEIVAALFALPEPSTLSLAILGTALVAAAPLRRWRKRRRN